MTARVVRLVGPAVGVVLLGGVVAALAADDPAPAAPNGKAAAGPGKPAAPHAFAGVAACIGCHSFENAEANLGAGLYVRAGSTKFVRLSENIVWTSHDLHARAFENLDPAANPTARRMQDRLAPGRPAGYTITADVACLACHASDRGPAGPGGPKTAASFDTLQGVSCEMCHGPASNWLQPHADIRAAAAGPPGSAWREWPAAAKAEWGLTDLRSPATAARTCASCHVGDHAAGRFVTHEMFAAGHPPLPPLDLMAYAREQPRHWGLPGDRPGELPYVPGVAKRDKDAAWRAFHYRADESYAARRFAEGAVGVLRETLRLTGQLADEAAKAGDGLDYAAFDCAACHHDLKYPSARQARGYAGKPGRPLFRPAPFALARLVVDHAARLEGWEGAKDPAKGLGDLEKKLAGAFGSRTFGDPGGITSAVAAADQWCVEVLTGLAEVRYDRKAVGDLLEAVVKAGQGPVGDPEVAQLYAWAFETLVLDLSPPPDPKGEPALPPAVAQLHARLDGHVVTRLRPGQKFWYEPPTPDAKLPATPPQPVDQRIGERMKAFNAFRLDEFNSAFGEAQPAVDALRKP